jgi:N4-gp56 family major capsid protein
MASTKLSDIINPQVMANMIEAKITAQCKITPYAHVNTDLQGVPGDTLTVPSWNYIGDAADFDPENAAGDEIETTKLTAGSTTFTVKCAAKAVSILQTAINSGLGNPVAQANLQLAKSIIGKIDNDVLAAAYTATTVHDAAASIGYAGIVDAISKFQDEEDGIDKVMFIHPNQEATLLKDADFISADKFTAGVALNGAIGKIAGCWIKKSLKVKTETIGTGASARTVYVNPIIKTEPDSSETEYTEDELPALTIFLKKDTQVDHEWLPKKQRHDFTAAKYYGVALTNSSKVVLAKFNTTATV